MTLRSSCRPMSPVVTPAFLRNSRGPGFLTICASRSTPLSGEGFAGWVARVARGKVECSRANPGAAASGPTRAAGVGRYARCPMTRFEVVAPGTWRRCGSPKEAALTCSQTIWSRNSLRPTDRQCGTCSVSVGAVALGYFALVTVKGWWALPLGRVDPSVDTSASASCTLFLFLSCWCAASPTPIQ